MLDDYLAVLNKAQIRKRVLLLNTDWKNLKLSSSGLPTWDSFIPYILHILVN